MIINPSSYTSAIPVALNDDINIPGPEVRKSGTTTSLTNNKLVDTNGKFLQTVDAKGNITNQGVQVGQVVYNMAAMNTTAWLGPEAATVTAVDSDTQLSLSANIFPVTGAPSTTQEYKIYDANQADPKGAIIMVGDNQAGNNTKSDIFVKTLDGQDVLVQGVAPGETLDLVVQRVMVGSAATSGAPSTLTTAEKITAFI
jgi:hypothetical protein